MELKHLTLTYLPLQRIPLSGYLIYVKSGLTTFYPSIFLKLEISFSDVLNSRKIQIPAIKWEPFYTKVYKGGKVDTCVLGTAQIGCPMNFQKYPVST